MNTQLFQEIGKLIKSRRPAWQCIIEDEVLRILTHQFIVDWRIITEIIKIGYTVDEVVSHGQFGVVITVRTMQGV